MVLFMAVSLKESKVHQRKQSEVLPLGSVPLSGCSCSGNTHAEHLIVKRMKNCFLEERKVTAWAGHQ